MRTRHSLAGSGEQSLCSVVLLVVIDALYTHAAASATLRPPQAEPPGFSFARCDGHFSGQRWQAAALCFEEGLKLGGEVTDAARHHNHAGVAWHNIGDYKSALEHYRVAAQLNASVALYHYNLGMAAAAVDHFEEAVKALRRALSLHKEDRRFATALGNLFFNKGKFVNATKYYRIVGELAPEDHSNWNFLGVAYAEINRYGKAIPAYRTAAYLNRKNPTYRFNLGMAYMNGPNRAGDLVDAVRSLEEAHFMDQNNVMFAFNLGTAYFHSKMYENATNVYTKAEQLARGESGKPTSDGNYPNMIGVGRVERMHQIWQELETFTAVIDPVSGRYVSNRQPSYFSTLEELHSTEDAFTQASKANPKVAVYKFNLANVAFQHQQYEKAAHYYEEAFLIEGKNAEYASMAGVAWLELGNDKEAVPWFEQAVQLNPESALFNFYRGRAFYNLKLWEKAAHSFKAASTREPGNANYRNWWATTLYELERYEEAAKIFTEALAVDDYQQEHHIIMGGTFYTIGPHDIVPHNFTSAVL